jgi:adenylate cyclase
MGAHTIGQFAGDLSTAISAIDRALMLNPNSAHVWNIRGWLNLYMDQPEAAIDSFEQAMRLSPLDPQGHEFTSGMARGHLTAGRYDQAMVWVDRAIAEQPRFNTALRIKVVLCELLDRHGDARLWLDRLREEVPDMTIESFGAYAARNYTPALRTLYVEALRRAGLPEE